MATETILNELWEIAQKNNREEIEENSFKKDLSNSIYTELEAYSGQVFDINDEFDRTLPLILAKAEVSPKILGETKGGSFRVSSEIVIMAVKSVKYENQFIEGTPEYEKRHSNEKVDIGIKDVILTAVLIDKMIDNYTDLTYNEKQALIENYTNMTESEQQAMLKKVVSGLESLEQFARENGSIEDANMYKNTKKAIENITDIKRGLSSKDIREAEHARQILNQDESFMKYLQNCGKSINISIEELLEIYNEFSKGEVEKDAHIESLGSYIKEIIEAQRKLKSIDEIKKIMEEDTELFESFLTEKKIEKKDMTKEDIANYIEFATEELREYHNQITNPDINKSSKEQSSKKDEFYEVGEAESISIDMGNAFGAIILDSESKLNNKNHQDAVQDKFNGEDNFQVTDNKKIIDEYVQYFESLEDDDLKYLLEEIDKDGFVDTLNQELNTIEDKRTLNLMISATYLAKDLLKVPKDREEFFSKMGTIIDVMKQRENTGLIKDEEMQEIFRQVGIDLQVDQFEPIMEEDTLQSLTPEAFIKPILSTELDGIYINGVHMEVDRDFSQVAMDAQEKGEDLVKAVRKYLKNQELENREANKALEGMDKHVEPEIIVVDESQEQVQEQTGNEQEKNENIVVIKKGKEGKIQVLRPIQFLKKTSIDFQQNSSKAGVTIPLINAQQDLITELVREEQRGSSGPVQEEQRD